MNKDEFTRGVGTRLRELRGSRSQREVATRAGVTQTSLSRWESGTLSPTAYNLYLLARGFEVDVSAMYPGDHDD